MDLSAGNDAGRGRWYAAFFLGAVLLAAGTALEFQRERREVLAQAHRSLAAVGRLKAEQAAAFREDLSRDAEALARSPLFAREAAALRAAPGPERQALLTERLASYRVAMGYTEAYLVDPRGHILAGGPRQGSFPPERLPALEEALRLGKPVLSDLHTEEVSPEPHLSVFAPLSGGGGAVVLVEEARRRLCPLLRRWPTESESAETLLVRREGGDVLYLCDLRFRKGAALSLRLPLEGRGIPAVEAALGRRGAFEGRDYRGVEVVADLRPVPGSPWFLVSKVDRREALAPLRGRGLALLAVLLLLALLAAFLAFLSKAFTKKALHRELRAERERRLDLQRLAVTLRSIGDAVLVADEEGRVTLLNPAAEALTGWSEAEALGKPVSQVFPIENEETGRRAEDPVARVLREGEVVGLANHTLLLSRDGRKIPIADSGAPIRDQEGRVAGVVLVFRDQTRERAAQRERRLLSAVLRGSAEEVYLFGAEDLRFRFLSGGALRNLGYTAEEALRLTPLDFKPEVTKEHFAALTESLRSGEKEVVRFETVHRRKDGSLYPVAVRLQYFDLLGEKVFLALIEDLTEKKKAEEAQRETEAMLQSILDTVPVRIFWKDRQSRYLGCNLPFALDAGCRDPQDLLGLDDFALSWKEQAERYRADDRAVMESGTPKLGYEEPQKSPGRQPKWLRTSKVPLRNARGEVIGVLGTYEDITKEKAREREVRLAAEAWQRTFDAIPDPLCVLDRDHRILQCNAAMEAFTGRSAQALRGTLCHEAVHGSQSPHPHCPFEKALRSGHRDRVEMPVGERTFEILVDPLLGPGGEVEGAVHVMRDVTEQRALEERFLQAQKMEAVGRLAGGIAHDFNNLLNVINIYAQLGLRKTAPEDPLQQDLRTIQEAGLRAAALTRQILAFSRRQQAAPQVLDLNGTVESLGKMLARLLGESVAYRFLPGEGVWPVRMDPSHLEQILANLTVNARDAMARGGSLLVETKNGAIDTLYGESHPGVTPGDYVLLAVTDSGCGMDKETLARCFEPYFSTKGKGGTGLGLSTVYGLAKQYGGFVNAYSEVGKGTTFKVYLPRYTGTEAPATPAPAAPEEAPAGRGETVLLVEDERPLLEATRRILEGHGYKVLAAPSPGDALLLAEGHGGAIDLLFTDVVMPILNGRELYEKLLPLRPGLKVLYTSGFTDNVIAHHGVLEGGIPFLGKPYTIGGVLTAVRKALDREGPSGRGG
ncbi:MAG: PAS domain-containing protein [Acidobacteriota bacterium]